MTGAPVSLRLIRQATTPPATESASIEDRPFTALKGIEPDDGRLAHPATLGSRRRAARPSGRLATEAHLVGFVCDLLQAPDTAVGTVTNRLGEAALLVMHGAREARPYVGRPIVVLPQSAHPAWFTAAQAVGLTPVVVPVDADGRVPIGPLTAAITDDAVLVVASAASYTHGTVDPIAWIAAACGTRVPLHVDATSGGWALAYAHLTGRLRQPWGFAVQGVTSITLDVGPERGAGADLSLLIHRSAAARRTTQLAAIGERGPLDTAAAWAPAGSLLTEITETLREVGHARCAELALDALDATAMLARGLLDVAGVTLAAHPDATTITLRADATIDIFVFADALHHRGWSTQPVLPDQGMPDQRMPMVRLQVTAAMLPLVGECLVAIEESCAEARGRGRSQVDPTLERLLDRLDPSDVDECSAGLLLDAAAVLDAADGDQRDRRASTNLLLRAAPAGVRQVLLSVLHDRLSIPVRDGAPELVVISTDENNE